MRGGHASERTQPDGAGTPTPGNLLCSKLDVARPSNFAARRGIDDDQKVVYILDVDHRRDAYR
jgi:hypothetical protein